MERQMKRSIKARCMQYRQESGNAKKNHRALQSEQDKPGSQRFVFLGGGVFISPIAPFSFVHGKRVLVDEYRVSKTRKIPIGTHQLFVQHCPKNCTMLASEDGRGKGKEKHRPDLRTCARMSTYCSNFVLQRANIAVIDVPAHPITSRGSHGGDGQRGGRSLQLAVLGSVAMSTSE
ncbi:hypothetical protein EDD21DRAFT_231031 [Dissophora ornata]|nr:hypothetical protein EDD21DRAFT_231031 [Dissophora ornata]